MRHFLFLDESGEANVVNDDKRFNGFVLCGVMFREDHYEFFNQELIKLKQKIFQNEDIIFHSYEMRKWKGPFYVFQDKTLLKEFYVEISKILIECEYKVFSCVVDKAKYRKKYPGKNFAYEDALTFICERAVACIGIKNKSDSLTLCLEKRDGRKDSSLKKVYTKMINYGTDYVSTDALKMCNKKLFFRAKGQNINGLQLADILAYPIANKFLHPESPQPTYDIIISKFYCNHIGDYKGYGLKIFP